MSQNKWPDSLIGSLIAPYSWSEAMISGRGSKLWPMRDPALSLESLN